MNQVKANQYSSLQDGFYLLYLAYSSASTHPLSSFTRIHLYLARRVYIIAFTVWFMDKRTSEKGVFKKAR